MRVLITGAGGFIGKNLGEQLAVRFGHEVLRVGRESTAEEIERAIGEADAVCHLAGVNRPDDVADFARGNTDFTRTLCRMLQVRQRHVPVIFASTIHADRDMPYGRSKREAEEVLRRHGEETGSPVHIFRLPNVFGKWCRPDYNSAVATFCHNVARDLPIRIDDPVAPLSLVYVDDVVEAFADVLAGGEAGETYCDVSPTYQITVGQLADQIRMFRESRGSLTTEAVGTGLTRALYATYVSYLPPKEFVYRIPQHGDERGVFVEMLKTRDSGQFSFFTAHPGVTRGGHYHHTKTEKFLVIRGDARFRFRHILTGEERDVSTSGTTPQIVETVPGWAHDVTNVGTEEMIVMLWANEVFDRARPDTYAYPL